MKFQRKRREKVDITLISMIDVLFVLLLFFMVSTTFNRHTEVKIKLPEANGKEADNHPKSVNVTIDEKGVYFLMSGNEGQSRRLPDQKRETLMRELVRLSQEEKELPFIISADAKTPHQSVMTVLDVAGQVGFDHITFATQESEGSEETDK
ncbi:biopolymer transport protein ExbD/TolR [Methyloglobulus morosus KoM1]|uniref:Biopolymer transport protein ExbD/TolR n=1 Tax=Methyloglobulus morosus KoM1 TaxID=1116472 RepID=V5BHZ1_9GAMM|nr:biopolymer transporter ExbD [Methyloglobulus morosus]ESS72925.1 biopolymer transport protein ExbD/TolR [Methyloglobulus morosus KoM1]